MPILKIDTPQKFFNHVNVNLIKYNLIYKFPLAPFFHIFTVIGNGYDYDNDRKCITTDLYKHFNNANIPYISIGKQINTLIEENSDITVKQIYEILLKKYSIKELDTISYFTMLSEKFYKFYKPEKATPIKFFRVDELTINNVYLELKNKKEILYPMSLDYFIFSSEQDVPKWMIDIAYIVILGCLQFITNDMENVIEGSYNYLVEFTSIKLYLESLGATLCVRN